VPARRVIVLGSTGSIGRQTLEVIRALNALSDRGESDLRFEVVGLAARGRDPGLLTQQLAETGATTVALADPGAIAAPEAAAPPGPCVRTLHGPDAAERLVREVPCDLVVAAMVGSAGLPATLAAAELGRDIALANKETLVAAGELVVPAARRSGACLLPVDSEHSAIWQCLQGAARAPAADVDGHRVARADCPPMATPEGVERVILTASGGPFWRWPKERIDTATPADALNHPTWTMGPRVTVDSASLMNKAMEVIEAHWLFGLPGARIGVLVHPQSLVHSLVEFADGSVLAQIGAPDMRWAIQYALCHPRRLPGPARKVSLPALGGLEFCPPDLERFPALALGYEVLAGGGTSGAVFNAAGEAAVAAFLSAEGRIPFGRIAGLVRGAMTALGCSPLRGLGDVMTAEAEARRWVAAALASERGAAHNP